MHANEIVVNTVGRSRGMKNDRVDAYALAEKLRIGAVDKPVFKAPSIHLTVAYERNVK